MFTRAMSPPLGSSSLMTSAPRKPRICVQAGPPWVCVISMMRTPDKAWSMVALLLPAAAHAKAECDEKEPRAGPSHRIPAHRGSVVEVRAQCPTLVLAMKPTQYAVAFCRGWPSSRQWPMDVRRGRRGASLGFNQRTSTSGLQPADRGATDVASIPSHLEERIRGRQRLDI